MFAGEDRWDYLIRSEASEQGVPVALVKAVVANETRFRWIGDPHPVTGVLIQSAADLDRYESSAKDYSVGVMQVLTGTAKWVMGETYSREDLRDPGTNIRVGVRYLSMLFNGWRPLHSYDGAGNLTGTERIVPRGVRGLTVEESLAGYNGGPGILNRRAPDGTWPNQVYVTRGLRAYEYFSGKEAGTETVEPAAPGPGPESPSGPSGGAVVGVLLAVAAALGLLFFRR